MRTRQTRQRATAAREIAQTLTLREREVARLLVRGLPNKEIGRRLSISEGTVKIHLHNIYGKLKVPSRLALAYYARQRGFAGVLLSLLFYP